MLEQLTQWEGEFLLFLQENLRFPLLDKIMQFITSLGDAGFIAILACLALLLCPPAAKIGGALRKGSGGCGSSDACRGYGKAGLAASLSLLAEFLLTNMLLKRLIARTRPYHLLEELLLITREPGDFSFPSGHAGACFAVASVLFLCLPRKIGVPAVALAGLIAFSRLYVGAHFPTDVLGGILIGCLTGWLAVKAVYGKMK